VPAFSVPSDLHARIVAALTVARRDARLRQVDLAKRLGWQQAYVSRYETGERQLSVDEYVAVALAMGSIRWHCSASFSLKTARNHSSGTPIEACPGASAGDTPTRLTSRTSVTMPNASSLASTIQRDRTHR
jgi:hypothetical protein